MTQVYITLGGPDVEQPCKDAVQVRVRRWDRRTFKTPEEHDATMLKLGWNVKPWLEEGSHHGTWEGGIKRLAPEPSLKWILEVDDVFALAEIFGKVVIQPPNEQFILALPEIKIGFDYE